jgi:hypothetical protein
MKKFILALIIAASATATFAQTYTVLDTVVANDIKHQFITERIYGNNGLVEKITLLMEKEKLREGSIIFKAPTRIFLKEMKEAYLKYTASLQQVDTSSYELIENDYYLNGDVMHPGIIKEHLRLKTIIDSLVVDPDIRNASDHSEFIKIKSERDKVLKIKNQITSQLKRTIEFKDAKEYAKKINDLFYEGFEVVKTLEKEPNKHTVEVRKVQ